MRGDTPGIVLNAMHAPLQSVPCTTPGRMQTTVATSMHDVSYTGTAWQAAPAATAPLASAAHVTLCSVTGQMLPCTSHLRAQSRAAPLANPRPLHSCAGSTARSMMPRPSAHRGASGDDEAAVAAGASTEAVKVARLLTLELVTGVYELVALSYRYSAGVPSFTAPMDSSGCSGPTVSAHETR